MYSLVIPVYKNEENLPDLLAALTTMHHDLSGKLEVVIVVDGSPDNCYNILRQRLNDMPFASQLLSHSRNYGSFAAIRTGLAAAGDGDPFLQAWALAVEGRFYFVWPALLLGLFVFGRRHARPRLPLPLSAQWP